MTLSSQFTRRIARWPLLPLVSVGLALASGVAAQDADSCASTESRGEPVQSRMFADYVLQVIESETGDAAKWSVRRAVLHCGDERARAKARAPLVEVPGFGAAGLFVLATTIDAGERKVTELPSAIGRAGVTKREGAILLTIAYGWMVAADAEVPPHVAVADTEWAVTSGDAALSRAGWELRAVFQDPEAVERRAQRLMSCASQTAPVPDSFDGCLNSNERFTATQDTVARLWDAASPAARELLALWAKPTAASQKFFLDELPEQTPAVQYTILSYALKPSGETPAFATQGAVRLLQQALDEPQRRPQALPIDFTHDYKEGKFGVHAYADRYPIALDAAFDELTTYPDAKTLMQSLAALDHPWLTTQAGVWLFKNGQGEAGRHALRYTLEDDGLPSPRVLRKLAPVNGDTVPAANRALFLDVLRDGSLGKWNALTDDHLKPLLSDSEFIAQIREHIAGIPDRVRRTIGEFSPDRELKEQISAIPGFDEEMRAFEWAMRALMQSDPASVDTLIDALANEQADPWRAIAMSHALEAGRKENARALAIDLVNSPWQSIATLARSIVAVEK